MKKRTVYYNGTIITMDRAGTQHAVSVAEGRFDAIGESAVQRKAEDYDTEWVDLHGMILLPSFMDAHSHLSSYAMSFLQVSLEQCTSFEEILKTLVGFHEGHKAGSSEWITASGYDHNRLEEKAHPTAQLLDTVFPDRPVLISHKSGHFGVMNTRGLQLLGLEQAFPDGYLEEGNYINTARRIPLPAKEVLLRAYKQAQEKYASYGVTTVQEGMVVSDMLPMLQEVIRNDKLFLDVVAYADWKEEDRIYRELSGYEGEYRNHFRLGGYKMILDGSPQGRTAWMLEPYLPIELNYMSAPVLTDGEVREAVEKAIQDRQQLLVHVNGDAAVEQILKVSENMKNTTKLRDLRPVLIHAQLITPEQLRRAVRLGFMPSFFISHIKYWGDVHIKNFGMRRASGISPAGTAERLRLPYTLHQDTPVLEPNMLETIRIAAERRTRRGVLLGMNERITLQQAYRAVTRNCAYQYGEENEKGSISVGKKADFVIMDKNPLECEPEELEEIKILFTAKEGRCVFGSLS